MRNPMFLGIFGVIVILFGLLNYYIGLRGWQTLGSYLKIPQKIYWAAFWVLAFSYMFARIAENFMPAQFNRYFVHLGANWLVFMYYFIIVIAAIDLLRWIGKLTGVLPGSWTESPRTALTAGLSVLVIVTIIWAYGTWNARNPRITSYEINVNKTAGSLESLRVVMVSDIHLGTIVGTERLSRMITAINGLNPDVVFLAGDIIDEDIEYFKEYEMDQYFSRLRSKYGSYAVLGNHEYIGRNADEAVNQLTKGGIRVLRDGHVKVVDSFYVAGRDDRSGARFTGVQRKSFEQLLEGVDKALPIFLLDHQPVDLGSPQKQGIDLQVSGHTHRGQMFPNQLITGRIYEKDYGLYRNGDFHAIISSGYGTWGPPVRIGNKSEIVDIKINFKKQN